MDGIAAHPRPGDVRSLPVERDLEAERALAAGLDGGVGRLAEECDVGREQVGTVAEQVAEAVVHGRHLFARCATKLCHIVRKAPFGLAQLSDDEVRIDFSTVTTPRDRVAVVATSPLTSNETWTGGNPGDLWVFDGGALRATLSA